MNKNFTTTALKVNCPHQADSEFTVDLISLFTFEVRGSFLVDFERLVPKVSSLCHRTVHVKTVNPKHRGWSQIENARKSRPH